MICACSDTLTQGQGRRRAGETLLVMQRPGQLQLKLPGTDAWKRPGILLQHTSLFIAAKQSDATSEDGNRSDVFFAERLESTFVSVLD